MFIGFSQKNIRLKPASKLFVTVGEANGNESAKENLQHMKLNYTCRWGIDQAFSKTSNLAATFSTPGNIACSNITFIGTAGKLSAPNTSTGASRC